MGLSRATFILFLFEFSPVFPSGGRRETSLPFSYLLKNGEHTKEKSIFLLNHSESDQNINFFSPEYCFSRRRKKHLSAKKKKHWGSLTALNFNIWLEPRKGGDSCHVSTVNSLLQPMLPCLLWGQIPLQSLTLPQPKAMTSPLVTVAPVKELCCFSLLFM